MRTRLKICGITRPEDGLAAATAGADAIGLVFYPPSPRDVDLAQAEKIITQLPPFVCKVGLFVDPIGWEVNTVIESLAIDLLQFHGDEPEEFCLQFGLPYIKALSVKQGFDLQQAEQDYASASALLLDTYHPDKKGGTGDTFDWDLISATRNKPIILAGGLTSKNIESAIEQVKPYAVDVSGGVESEPGIKNPLEITQFAKGVARVNS